MIKVIISDQRIKLEQPRSTKAHSDFNMTNLNMKINDVFNSTKHRQSTKNSFTPETQTFQFSGYPDKGKKKKKQKKMTLEHSPDNSLPNTNTLVEDYKNKSLKMKYDIIK